MILTSSFTKLTSRHAQERLELLSINNEGISITSMKVFSVCRRDGGLYLVECCAKLRDIVYGLGMFRVDADAFTGKSWIWFLFVSGFSGLIRVIYVSVLNTLLPGWAHHKQAVFRMIGWGPENRPPWRNGTARR